MTPDQVTDSTARLEAAVHSRNVNEYPHKAKERVDSLIGSLKVLLKVDGEQEVTGSALAVIDAVLTSVKGALPDDEVVAAVAEIFSADTIGTGDPVRAADLLVVAEQLSAAIGDPPLMIG